MSNQNSLAPVEHLRAKLPYSLHSLANLAFNFWWSWSPECLSMFRSIDSEKWEQYHHEPSEIAEHCLQRTTYTVSN